MRILLVQNSSYFPSYGGGNKSDRLMMNALARCGHSCGVIARIRDSSPHGHDEYLRTLEEYDVTIISTENGVVVFTLDSVEVHVATTANVRSCCSRHLVEFEPHAILVSTDPLNVLICDLVGTRNAKVVYLARTTMLLPFGPESTFPSQKKTEAIRRADLVVAVSCYLADYVIEHSRIPAIHLPIQMMEAKPESPLGSFDNSFITMVNPCALKGISIFLGLVDAFPSVAFAAVPTWGTTAEDRVELALRSNICILDPVDDIRDILRQTRVTLVPSLWAEGRARIIVESMLSGIPVLASDRGGTREATMGVPCWLPVNPIVAYQDHLDDQMNRVPEVPIQNLNPWRDALERLITDREYYSEHSRMSYEAAARYAADLSIGPFETLLGELTEM